MNAILIMLPHNASPQCYPHDVIPHNAIPHGNSPLSVFRHGSPADHFGITFGPHLRSECSLASVAQKKLEKQRVLRHNH